MLLKDQGWTSKQDECLKKVKNALYAMVLMSYPKENWDVCVHTDASKAHWRAIVTQLAPGELPKERAEQNHLPLAFISFSFRGSMLDGQLLRKKRMQ